jgi:hypothetical protein
MQEPFDDPDTCGESIPELFSSTSCGGKKYYLIPGNVRLTKVITPEGPIT